LWQRIDVLLETPRDRDGFAVGTPRNDQSPIKNSRGLAMSKFAIIFVLLMSGALYDPPRVLHQLGPQATSAGWQIAHTLRMW
jgi:hypothetical protein